MLLDAISATIVDEKASASEKAVAAFLGFIEKKLGVSIVRNVRDGEVNPELFEPLQIASRLVENGIITQFSRSQELPDEPRLYSWHAVCNDESKHSVAGTTWDSDTGALRATLSEGLERYIWFTQDDYFVNPTFATVSEIASKGRYIAPEKISGFSDEQRGKSDTRKLRADAKYLWIQGTSLVQNSTIYIPAQIISGLRSSSAWPRLQEPQIRPSSTIGLATWPTLSGAQLAGINEQLEREAYMIMWLNQLTLPRYSLSSLCEKYPDLVRVVETCERYRLKMHVVKLLTDSPTHAIAVIMEDQSGFAPRYSIGLRANRNLSDAVKKAATEALRVRRGQRNKLSSGEAWDETTPVDKIGHRERTQYWAVPKNAERLAFMVQGPVIVPEAEIWEKDSEDEHLQRVVEWCAKKNFECISVPLTSSAKNITPLYIEMSVIPELQPAYLTEQTRAFCASRLQEVPRALGYTPLKSPYIRGPHPFS